MGEFFNSIGNFFKGIFSAAATVTNIFSYLASHLIYLLAGALVAFVILLIWSLVIKKMPNWIICVLVSIVCIGSAFGVSALIEKNQKNNNGEIPFIYPENAPVTIDGDKYLTTIGNGGYSYEKLKELLVDPSTPTHDDRYLDLNITEYNDMAILSYNRVLAGETYTFNVMFDKIDDKFAFTGCMNFKINQSGILWWANYSFENKMWMGDNFSPLANKLGTENGLSYTIVFDESKSVAPRYYSKTHSVSIAQLQGASKWTAWSFFGNQVYECAIKGCYDILQDYFVSFSPFNIMTHESKVETDLNAFYSAVIKQTQIAGDNALIDVSNETVVIDSNSQVYKGKNYIKANYLKYDSNAYDTKPADKGVQEIKDKTLGGATKEFEVKPEIQILCKSTNNFDVEKIPEAYLDTIIQLTNQETGEVIQYKFDNIDSLKNGKNDNLSYGKYNYVVVSKYFDFKTNQGEFEIKKGDSQFIFEYEYKSDIVDLTIRFENAGDSLEGFDITAQPVSIRLENTINNTETTFVFKTQDSFENGLKKPVEIGSYTLTIISEGLKFKDVPAIIDVTVEQHELVFSYHQIREIFIRCSFASADMSETEKESLGHYFFNNDSHYIEVCIKNDIYNYKYKVPYLSSDMFSITHAVGRVQIGKYDISISSSNKKISFSQFYNVDLNYSTNDFIDILIYKKTSDHKIIITEDGLSTSHIQADVSISNKNNYLLYVDVDSLGRLQFHKIKFDDNGNGNYLSTIGLKEGEIYYYVLEHDNFIDVIGFQYKNGIAYKISIE